MDKAYRANTESKQIDGLYKDKKFTKKVALLNHSRAEFNILRPYEISMKRNDTLF